MSRVALLAAGARGEIDVEWDGFSTTPTRGSGTVTLRGLDRLSS